MDKKRIYFTDWLDRMDMLLCMAYGKRTGSYQGIDWERLYNAGHSPGEVFEAFVESVREMEQEAVAVNG